jgi:23S rRNA pseudouridine955/2504/2580 synthase
MIRPMNETSSKVPAARVVTVGAEQDGQRIDNFLVRHMKGVPKSHIYRVLRKGEVRVNKGRIRADYRVKCGDLVRIPPIRQSEHSLPGRAPKGTLERLEQVILYEDKDLLALDKPSGLAVHGGSGLGYGIIEALRQARPAAEFMELVHRLDRETSGCLLVAKNRKALVDLHAQLRRGAVDKRYLALAAGRWQGGIRRVSAPLQKNAQRGGERLVRVSEEGRLAVTRFTPVSVYKNACLLEAQLDTGRTHQIRVHAAHIGHPLAGDEKYGSAAFNRSMKELGLKRLFLHAHSLSFRRPNSDREIHVSAPLAPELQRVLDRLESV